LAGISLKATVGDNGIIARAKKAGEAMERAAVQEELELMLVDLQTEKIIQNIIDKISKDSTVIIIAHRKSTIESSDNIIYLKEGCIDKVVSKSRV